MNFLVIFKIHTVLQTISCQADTVMWEKLVGHSILIEHQLSFDVNFSNGLFNTIFNTINHAIVQNPFHTTAIYDIIMESQQFECNRFKLNPVLRMAIMRKVI